MVTSRRIAGSLLLGLLALLGCGAKGQGDLEPAHAPACAVKNLILVREDLPWLSAVAAPVTAKLRDAGAVPMLAVVGSPPNEATAALLRRIEPKDTWLLAAVASGDGDAGLRRLKPQLVATGVDPVDGSYLVARRFWSSCDEVVAATANDPRGILLAAAIAAQKASPLLICEASGDESRFAEYLRKLGVHRVVFVSEDKTRERPWAKRLKVQLDVIDAVAAQRRLTTALVTKQPRTVILTREPSSDATVGATAWLAPYLSLLHGAPLVVCRSADALEAEGLVMRLIDEHHLPTQTLTILADYDAIGTKRIVIGAPGAERPRSHSKKDPPYEVNIEPCMPADCSGVVRLGIGRIPFATLEDASALLARGIVRHATVDAESQRAFVAANSRPAAYPLPLCETISRLTAEELGNCGMRLDGFYGVPSDSPAAVRVMRLANLILFEGHTLYQDLFPADSELDEEPEEEETTLDPMDRNDHAASQVDVAVHDEMDSPTRPGAGDLTGFPIVVLQSCDSLKPEVFARVHLQGGAALVGATTAIHSGSGSALAKALCDSMLYRGATLGEALRDAQNFLMCLQELRGQRKHNELAKVQRVAMSFRLWGDPELEGIVPKLQSPRIAPVSAQRLDEGSIIIQLPGARLPAVATAAYVAAIYPGSEASGIVQTTKDSSARRLSPVYFFRLSWPEAAEFRLSDEYQGRAVVRVDRAGKVAYLVFMPEGESPGMKVKLRSAAARGRQS